MKKISILAAALCMIFAGCTSENDDYETDREQQKISFTRPVIKGITRTVTGEINSPYPTNENFIVFGKRYKGEYPGWEGCLEEYNTTGEVTNYNTSLNGWETTISHYWINEFLYTFAAYSPAGASGQIAYGNTGLSITGFTPAAIGSQYDLMYAKRIYGKSKNDMITGKKEPNYNGIPLVFSHALSSIVFNIGVDKKYAVDNKGKENVNVFKIKSIKIKGIYNTGNFVENISSDEGTPSTTYAAAPSWTASRLPGSEDYTLFSDPNGVSIPIIEATDNKLTPITQIGTTKGNNAILIPQTFDENNNNGCIEVVWTGNGNDPEGMVVWNTSTIYLKDKTPTWQIGYRYTYNLKFTKDLIIFSPSVEAWTDASSNIDI